MSSENSSGFMFEADMEDDLFYAEIKRRILQLTIEDEEGDNVGYIGERETKRVNNTTVYRGGGGDGGGLLFGPSSGYGLGGGGHVCSWEAQSFGGPPPVWLMNLWKNGKGTGVFIPQATRCKKNSRTGTYVLFISMKN